MLAMGRWWRQLKPLAWVLPAVVFFAIYDRALEGFYAQHQTAREAIISRGQFQRALDNDIVVLGDSCARYGIDTSYITEETGIDAYNLATFAEGFPGQISVVRRALARGQRFDAIITMGTENFARIRSKSPESVTQQYYASLDAVALLHEYSELSLEETLELLWASASPSYAAGSGLSRFTWRSAKRFYRDGDLSYWRQLRKRHRKLAAPFEKARGQSRGGKSKQGQRIERRVQRFLQKLDKGGNSWNERYIGGHYLELVRVAQRHGIPVFHTFCPRDRRLVQHRRWKAKFDEPMLRWGRELESEYSVFRYWMPKRMAVETKAFANSPSHLRKRQAKQLTEQLLEAMRPVLAGEAPGDSR